MNAGSASRRNFVAACKKSVCRSLKVNQKLDFFAYRRNRCNYQSVSERRRKLKLSWISEILKLFCYRHWKMNELDFFVTRSLHPKITLLEEKGLVRFREWKT